MVNPVVLAIKNTFLRGVKNKMVLKLEKIRKFSWGNISLYYAPA